MARYLLYVALQNEGEGSTEFETVDEVVEAVTTLLRDTFSTGRQLVTFSVGDISETVREAQLVVGHEEGCAAGEYEGRECTCSAPMIEKEN